MTKEQELTARRHSLAHLLAAAVLKIYPEAKTAIGPAIDSGFYYDFDLPAPVGAGNLPKIEAEMRKLLPSWRRFKKINIASAEARKKYAANPYKLELINELANQGETLTLYRAGQDDGEFTDLCRGGHLDDLSQIDPASFRLDRVAGAYWRGDEKNKMLTRIYGLAFATGGDLEKFLADREEAVRRDHRNTGKDLDLFTFSDLVGPGLPLFTAKGTVLRNEIIKKIHAIQKPYGYEEVWIPHLTKKELYQVSGHWDKFGDELFQVKGKSGAEFVIKPMNCPHHTQIYAAKPRSYRDLPIRLTEATTVYRDEKPGELLGLSRVRSLTQDDGHVFCRLDQVEEEITNMVAIIKEFYSLLGLFDKKTYWVSLSVRDPKQPEKYIGDPANWDKIESTLETIARKTALNYRRVEGEAAFYGAKLDFMFKDSIGREWQLATIQLDFNMAERFGLEYTDEAGGKKTPVIIHRAIAGSIERFLSIIIEHFAGAFPVWLSPVQAKILPVSEKYFDYAKKVLAELKSADVRAELDSSDETLGKKVRRGKQEKTPYLIIVGAKEAAAAKITVESRDTGDSRQTTLIDFVKILKKEV